MSSLPVIVCDAALSADAMDLLRARTRGHRLVEAGQEWPEATILFGQPDPAATLLLENLRWIQVTSAGFTRYDTADFREAAVQRGIAVTNSSSVYDEPCAQHLLALMLAGARQLPQAWSDQQGLRRWLGDSIRPASILLQGQTVLLVGYGAIARRMVELLGPFDVEILAFRRNVRGDEGVTTLPIDRLADYLPGANHVANIVPANASSDGLFGRHLFQCMKPGAVFYNIGRGSTVDQNALIESLSDERLSAAFLDVMEPEPLPSAHPLWTTPNCFITPHSAGGHRGEGERLVFHFLENLRRFESGSALKDRVI